jgi:SAM-dependent methyltransferase
MLENEESYWDGVAATYDDQVFNTLENDRNGTIVQYVDRIASRRLTVADFGCGAGKYVSLLSSRFKDVIAIDHSDRLLEIARKKFGKLPNVTFLKADLANPSQKLPPVDAAISMNVLLSPDWQKRANLLKTIAKTLRGGAPLALMVPSLESSLLSISRLGDWNRRSKARHNGVSADAISGARLMRKAISSGVIMLEDQPTKHFLLEEIKLLVRSVGLDIESADRVEYSWTYEFDKPPRWMKEPYPWDWILACRKP